MASFSGHSSGISSLAVDGKTGKQVISGCVGGSVRLWDVQAEKCVTSMAGHAAAVRTSEFHPFGNFFATAATDGVTKIWDARNKKSVQQYRTEEISDLKFSPHGRWLASAGNFGAKIWDLAKAGVVWETSEEEISAFAFHPVDFFFLTSERKTNLWNCTVENFGSLAFQDPQIFPAPVSHVAFSADGASLFQAAPGNFRFSRVAGDATLTTAAVLVEPPWKSGKVLDIFPDAESGECLVLAADASDGLFAPNLSVHRTNLATATGNPRGERRKRDVPVEILTSSTSIPAPEVVKSGSREISALSGKLGNLRRVVSLWAKGSTIQAASEAAQDPGLFGNFLSALPLEKQNVPLSLDLCRQLLVLMARALTETKSEILANACIHATNVLLARFGDFIRDNRESEISAGVDLQRDLRIEKCDECFEGFRKISSLLSRFPSVEKENFDALKSFLGN